MSVRNILSASIYLYITARRAYDAHLPNELVFDVNIRANTATRYRTGTTQASAKKPKDPPDDFKLK